MTSSPYACYPPLPSPERGFPFSISVDQTDSNKIALRWGTDRPNCSELRYPSGNNVVLRHLKVANDVFAYTGHATRRVQVAVISPNGQWVASGDNSGILKVWGAKGDHADKGEFRLWSGDIRGISWSPDSQRIAVCGSGREISAACIGDLSGHQKGINSISFRPARPFRIATGSEDTCVNLYEGPPFKFKTSLTGKHTNFVQGVTYTPNGSQLVTCGSDGVVNVFDGSTAEFQYSLPKLPCTIFAVACPDDNTVVTACADKHVRCFDIGSASNGTLRWDVEVGKELADQQVGVAVAGQLAVITTCLDGRLLRWSVADGQRLDEFVGSCGAIYSVAYDNVNDRVLWASADSTLHQWKPEFDQVTCLAKSIRPTAGILLPPSTGVPVIVNKEGVILEGTNKSSEVADSSQLLGLHGGSAVVFSAKRRHIESADGRLSIKLEREPLAIAFSEELKCIAVSYEASTASLHEQVTEREVFIYDIFTGAEVRRVRSNHKADICILEFSQNTKHLAVGAVDGSVSIIATSTWATIPSTQGWTYHTSRIMDCSWSDDDKLATAGLDKMVCIFDVSTAENASLFLRLTDCHKDGVTAVGWMGDDTIVEATAFYVFGSCTEFMIYFSDHWPSCVAAAATKLPRGGINEVPLMQSVTHHQQADQSNVNETAIAAQL
ncbi:hypothetical protein FOL47_009870 [Perkinsus chesapeaki]|uniref:WD repeat-containing protein 1 n=1 Tax=Perkinsus chesapeaki TaxID=330153 RepID=A0A7J6L5Z6_PERCH|nr:hypothetical protein FOL47_009870 [Perkinsus chesapeaki]